jgi:hypothetical protein
MDGVKQDQHPYLESEFGVVNLVRSPELFSRVFATNLVLLSTQCRQAWAAKRFRFANPKHFTVQKHYRPSQVFVCGGFLSGYC